MLQATVKQITTGLAIAALLVVGFALFREGSVGEKPRPLVIDAVTTHVVSSLLSDGYVDLASYCNQSHSPESSTESNAVGHIVAAIDLDGVRQVQQQWHDSLTADADEWIEAHADTELYGSYPYLELQRRLQLAPWDEAEFAKTAKFILSQAGALTELEKAADSECFFMPIPNARSASEQYRAFQFVEWRGRRYEFLRFEDAIRLLSILTVSRVQLRMSKGEFDAAIADLMVLVRLSRRIAQQPDWTAVRIWMNLRSDVRDCVVSLAIRSQSERELNRLADLLAELEKESDHAAVTVRANRTHRCRDLSWLMAFHAGDDKARRIMFRGVERSKLELSVYRDAHLKIDTNQLLRFVNDYYDKVETVLAMPGVHQQREIAKAEPVPFEPNLNGDELLRKSTLIFHNAALFPKDMRSTSELIGLHLWMNNAFKWLSFPRQVLEERCALSLARMAIALQWHRITNGKYPGSLNELSEVEGFVRESDFADTFRDADLLYTVSDDRQSFELRSAGGDGQLERPSSHLDYDDLIVESAGRITNEFLR